MTASKKPGQPGNTIAMDDWGQRQIVTLVSSAYVCLSCETGALYVIPAMASGLLVTLPEVAAGLNYEFVVAGAISSAILVFKTPTTGTMVAWNDSAADSISIGKATGAPAVGASIRFVSDGTKWFSFMQPAFSSAAPTSATMSEFSIQT